MIDVENKFFMNVNDDVLYAFKIYDLLKTISLFHFFNDFLPSSFNTYQDINNITFE